MSQLPKVRPFRPRPRSLRQPPSGSMRSALNCSVLPSKRSLGDKLQQLALTCPQSLLIIEQLADHLLAKYGAQGSTDSAGSQYLP